MSIGVFAILVALVVAGFTIQAEGISLSLTNTKPKLWWVVDDSQVNARQWLDWGNRSTREPNEPYLQICKERAITLWGEDFDIVPLIGREAVSQHLWIAKYDAPEGVQRCPPAMWMAWARAALLKVHGGMWMDGSVLPIASSLPKVVAGSTVLCFGSDPDEGLLVAEQQEPAAGRSAGWAAVPEHPMWAGLERDLTALILEGPPSWGSFEARRSLRHLWDKHCSGVTRIDRRVEVSRDNYGRRLELDTLLGETEWPTGSTEGGLWVPFPTGREGLERATPWLWFLRMSRAQIEESKFLWAKLATTACSKQTSQ